MPHHQQPLKCAKTTSTCPRRRTRPSASSSHALSCAPAPGYMHNWARHMRGCGSTARKKISTAIYAWRHSHTLACGRAAAPSSHALHMHSVCMFLLLMHCTHLRQLPLLDDRLRGFMARRDRRGLRDPRMHRLEHRYVLRPGECPGGRRKVHGGAQEHAAGRSAHPPQPVHRRAPSPHPAHRPVCCSSSLAPSKPSCP